MENEMETGDISWFRHFPQVGIHLWSPYTRDETYLGVSVGSPFFWETYICMFHPWPLSAAQHVQDSSQQWFTGQAVLCCCLPLEEHILELRMYVGDCQNYGPFLGPLN